MASLAAALETVNSLGEGTHLILENRADLTYPLAEELRTRAEELRASGDSDGAEEFTTWSDDIRSTVTRMRILAHDASDFDEALRFLEANRAYFDDPFIELCVRVITG